MSRVRRRRLVVAIAVAVVAVLLPGCKRDAVAGEGRLDPKGRVLLTRDDVQATATGSRPLERGDAVEVAEGTAEITLPGGDVLELGPRSVLVLNGGPELRSGSVVLTTTGAPRTLRSAGSQVDAVGATRVDAALALRVVAYGGHAVVRSGGRSLDVPALRQASVPVIGSFRGPRPLDIDRADPWDRRFLGDAVRTESELESLAEGFTRQAVAADKGSVAYYRRLFPGLNGEQAFQQASVDRLGSLSANDAGAGSFQAGAVLVGAAIALQGRRGTFAERLEGAAAFRAEGASWALVGIDQQAPSLDGLVELIRSALNQDESLRPPAPGSRPTAAPDPGAASAPTTAVTRPTAPRSAPTTTPPTSAAPPTTRPQQPQPASPQPSPSTIVLPVDPLLDAVTDPVVKLLNDLLGTSPR